MTLMTQIAYFTNSYAYIQILDVQRRAQVNKSWLESTAQKQYILIALIIHMGIVNVWNLSYHTQVNSLYYMDYRPGDLWHEKCTKCSNRNL